MSNAGKLYPVQVDEKEGYIDSVGKLVLEPKFDSAHDFKGGFSQVSKFDVPESYDPVSGFRMKKIGFINVLGEPITPLQYRYARDFSEGLAAVMVDGKWGFIDTQGNEVVRPQFDAAYYFSEGVAPVEIGDRRKLVIDTEGTVLFELNASALGQCVNGLIPCEINRKSSFLDKTGKTVHEITCSAVSEFSEGLAPVLKRGLNGYINTSGEWVISPQFAQAAQFSEGLAAVEVPRMTDGKTDYSKPQTFGFINASGEMVIEPRFRYASSFSEGLAVVRTDDGFGRGGEYAYIDKTGEVVIPPIRAEYAGPFSGPLACIQDIDDDSYWYINREGDYVWPN